MQHAAYVPASETAKEHYSPSFLAAIDAALQLYPQDRPQSIGEWKALFTQMGDVQVERTVLRPLPTSIATPKTETNKLEIKLPVVMFAIAAVATAVLLIYLLKFPPTVTNPIRPAPSGQSELSDPIVPLDSPTVRDTEPAAVNDSPHLEAKLKIASIPTAAQVFLDGSLKGVTPIEATVGEGIYLLRLSLDDHYDWESSLQVETNGEIPIQIPLLAK
jgi:hypothetical protein